MIKDTAIFSGEDEIETEAHRDAQAILQSQYETCFGTPQGEKVLESLYQYCHQNSPSFVVGDSHYTAFREGQRSVILQIMKMLILDDMTIIARSRDRALKGN